MGGNMAWRFSGRELEYVREVLESGFESARRVGPFIVRWNES